MACIPNIIELPINKIEQNIESVENLFKLDKENLKSILIDYPFLISKLSSDLTKVEFYFKLYLEMSKEEFINLAKQFPLLLTSTVIFLFINQIYFLF